VITQWKQNGTLAGVDPAAVDAQKDSSGKQTGLPWCQDLRALSYNKRLFDKAGVKPPTNFDELRQAAKELTGGGVYGIGFCGTTALAAQQVIALMLNNGGGLYSAACGPEIVNDRNAEVAELIQNMVRDGSIPKAAVGWDNTDISNAMGRGEIAMTIGEPGLFSALPNGDEIDVTSPLTGPHGDKGTILWESAMWLYESAKNKKAAIDFMNWWLANEQPLWTKGGTTQLPVRKSFYQQIKSFEDPRYQKVIKEWVPVGKILSAPCDHALPTLNQVEGQAFLPTLAQNILQLKPIQPALQTAQDALGKLKAA
jgi:multiple sugar transport system substrate-binding protein